MRRLLFIFIILLFLSKCLLADNKKYLSDSVQTKITFDLSESNLSGFCMPYFKAEGKFYDINLTKSEKYYYLPFTIGHCKDIFKSPKSKISIDVAAFTQFEWKEVENKFYRNLVNIDYKISSTYFYFFNKLTWIRARIFHVSSHWGDDFMIRNQIRSYRPNWVNYEQLEIMALRKVKNFDFYLGSGYVIRPETERKRFSTQAGFYFQSKGEKLKFVAGSDLKLNEQTNFDININTNIGLQFGKENPVIIAIQYYKGHLPYSMYEDSTVEWAGIGLIFK